MGFSVKFDDTAASAEQTGFVQLDSGVYDAVIETASLTKASTGTMGIDWSFTINGAKQLVYGMWFQKADGTTLFSYNILQALMGLLGVKEITTYSKTIDVKNGQKIVEAIKEFDGKPVKVALQKVHDWYNGEESIKYEIKAFLDAETGQSFTEKKAGKEATQIDYYLKLKDKETEEYKKAMIDEDSEVEVTEVATKKLL